MKYNTIHVKLRRKRGKASTHSCQMCGNQAAHWALVHGTYPIQVELRKGRALVFSEDTDDYIPLCRKDHARYDAPHRIIRPVVYRSDTTTWERSRLARVAKRRARRLAREKVS